MYTTAMRVLRRTPSPAVALETTLLLHGVPAGSAIDLHRQLCEICVEQGAHPALVGLLEGRAVAGITQAELSELIGRGSVPKANTSNLGVLQYWGASAATTVSATMEIAASAGISVFATGGLGGIHQNIWTGGSTCNLDVSSDLAAMARFPVAVVSSGVKSILDVCATREALESLGVCVIGYGTDSFPAFYSRTSDSEVDGRIDDPAELAAFLRSELSRSGRGILIVNPIPEADEIPEEQFAAWHDEAREVATESGATGRGVTPAVLSALHEVSGGRTLDANLALIRSNTALAARLAALMHRQEKH